MTDAVKKFLALISFSEGTSSGLDSGYGVIVSGIDGAHSFTDYSDHPFAPQFGRKAIQFKPGEYSTASGRYQLLYRWWVPYKFQLKLSDFSPASQDAVAVKQMSERGALARIEAGDIQGAIEACSNIWASFPGAPYGQGGRSMAALLAHYKTL